MTSLHLSKVHEELILVAVRRPLLRAALIVWAIVTLVHAVVG